MNKITNDIYYVGVNDHQVDLFEGQYIVQDGMAYNSYVIMDEKITIMDTVDKNFTHSWFGNIKKVLGEKSPTYLVVQHMEPDHSANIINFLEVYPDTMVVGNSKTFKMIEQFFNQVIKNKLEVKDGATLNIGTHTLTFVFAPMVHWPEVMVTYDDYDKVLFSADGFGKFGALDVKKQNDEWDNEARRYYFGIVGKYGAQVQMLLKKAQSLDIKKICPLHGPVLSENLAHYLELYNTWSSYQNEKEGIVVAYTSVYGHTYNAVEKLVENLKNNQYSNVEIIDLARCDMSDAVSKAFQYSKVVLATTTYNASLFPHMDNFINQLMERNFQNKIVAIIENGSWAPLAGKVIKEKLQKCKNITLIEPIVRIMSSVSLENEKELNIMAINLTK